MSICPEDLPLLLPPECPQPEPDRAQHVWRVGKFVFRADFDSANLQQVRQGHTPSEFHLWTRRDCENTDNEKQTRSWFYYGVSGQCQGDFMVMNVMNLNKQGRLYSQDYRPWYWTPSMTEWQPIVSKVSYKREGDDFLLRFSFKFDTVEETFFAFAIPFSYRDTQNLLAHLDYTFQNCMTIPPECRCDATPDAQRSSSMLDRTSYVYYRRQLLTQSVEGRRVDIITITDCHGACEDEEPPMDGCFPDSGNEAPCAMFRDKKVFFVSSRVHPGETPATHMFNGLLAFLLRPYDARAAALRRRFVFKLVPLVNPDGVAAGNYRTDTLGQNLNRFYLGTPCQVAQPSVFAIKKLLKFYAQRGLLEFYIDLHAHANKKGVFNFGNALEGEEHVQSLLYAKLVSLNSSVFDFTNCNFTEKNMSRPDRDGSTREGAGRVALYREMGLTHLYTVEANYNTARVMNVVAAATGDHQGRASPPSGKRFPPRFMAGVLQGVGRAFAIAALDLKNANPWSRLPNTELRSTEGVRNWVLTCLRSSSEVRAQHLPPMSDISLDSVVRDTTPNSTMQRTMARRAASMNRYSGYGCESPASSACSPSVVTYSTSSSMQGLSASSTPTYGHSSSLGHSSSPVVSAGVTPGGGYVPFMHTQLRASLASRRSSFLPNISHNLDTKLGLGSGGATSGGAAATPSSSSIAQQQPRPFSRSASLPVRTASRAGLPPGQYSRTCTPKQQQHRPQPNGMGVGVARLGTPEHARRHSSSGGTDDSDTQTSPQHAPHRLASAAGGGAAMHSVSAAELRGPCSSSSDGGRVQTGEGRSSGPGDSHHHKGGPRSYSSMQGESRIPTPPSSELSLMHVYSDIGPPPSTPNTAQVHVQLLSQGVPLCATPTSGFNGAKLAATTPRRRVSYSRGTDGSPTTLDGTTAPSAIDPLLSNLRVVGKLPAYKAGKRSAIPAAPAP